MNRPMRWRGENSGYTAAPMTREHLLECHPAVRLQYVEKADRSPSVVPSEVMETISELNEYGTRPCSPIS
jgi:hypothetical protein